MLQRIPWAVLAAIHFLPALAFFRPASLQSLYGVERSNPLFVLMHHRAALFFAVFAICMWSAFDEAPRKAASVLTAISMGSFLLLYWQARMPAGLRTIAIADLVGVPFLIFVVWQAFLGAGRTDP